MAIQRTRTCTHCNKEFTTSQYAAKYCSTKCKTAARSTKKASNRIEKLPVSDAWLWISRECRRAGTVQILQDVDLEKLFAIYNHKYKCYGWDSENKQSKFHICHISPVKGKNTTGLLHHQNLFIGGSLPNQVQGTNSYAGAGLCISNHKLQSRWCVEDHHSDKQILAKVKKYLGQKLYEYAAKHPIKKAARFVVAERIHKLPNNSTPLAELQRMGTQALMKLEADLLDKEAFAIKLTAKRSLVVYCEELERLASYGGDKQEGFLFVAAAVRTVAQVLAQNPYEYGLCSITATRYRWYYEFKPLSVKPDKDVSKLRDFAAFTAFSTLQGAEVDRALITNTLRSYLQVNSLTVQEHAVPDFDDSFSDLLYLQEELAEFSNNVPKVKAAFELVGLLDAVTLGRIDDSARCQGFQNALQDDLGCSEYYEYPEHYFQAEDAEYPPPAFLSVSPQSPTWLPF